MARFELVSGERRHDWYDNHEEEVGLDYKDEDFRRQQLVVTALGQEGKKYIVTVVLES